jgi:epoxide hydrolase-like predicted phosphatase
MVSKEINGKMAINTIIFDFGGVIYKTPKSHQLRKIQRFFRIKVDPELLEMLEKKENSQIIREMCLGVIPEEKMWTTIATKLGVKPWVYRFFRRRLTSKKYLNKALVKFLVELSRNYKIGILSNAGDQTRSLLEDVFNLDRYVDEIIISAEEKMIKPDRQIYQLAVERLDTLPETSLFIDDQLVNVQAARDFGMKAVQFIETEQAIAEINAYLDGRG